MIELAPRRVAGAFRGLNRSRSGRFDGACHVSLSRGGFEHGAYFDHSLDFEPRDPSDPSSAPVARIEFDDVTDGEWFVHVHCHDGFEFPAPLASMQAPNEHLEIVLDDPTLDMRVRIVEAESGRPGPRLLRCSCQDTTTQAAFGTHCDQPLPGKSSKSSCCACIGGARP